ncbi:MAG: DUF1569 domain-containing protein [Phycisphaeraceae bacterium]|nr:MAG: DUF1569 domain-containing protein [Phycisphaeraceae bacterium]
MHPDPSTPVDSTKAHRRKLRLTSADDLLREAHRLAEAEAAGTLRRTGNWSLGRALAHLAAWTDTAYDGFPPEFQLPHWILRLLMRPFKRVMLARTLPAGIRLPRVEGGTHFIDPASTDEGLRRLERTVQRVRSTDPVHANVLLGPLTRAECERLLLRHAELHLSFFHTDDTHPGSGE